MTEIDFPTTRWTAIVRSRDGDAETRRALSERLCADYWTPVFSFIRASGHGREDAEDLTQSFFVRILDVALIDRADPSKGRLRSYLLGVLKLLLLEHRRREATLKRGGGLEFVPFDSCEDGVGEPIVEALAPDAVFDRNWAENLLERVLQVLCKEYAARGKAELYEAMRSALGGRESVSDQSDLAFTLGMGHGAWRVALHRFRGRFRTLVRAEIESTLAEGAEVESEWAALMEALKG